MKRISDPASAFRAWGKTSAFGILLARLCAILTLCVAMGEAGPYDTWAKYKTLTINTTGTGGGASVSGTVSNFPVFIRLTASNADDILGEALANGADVRFSSSDGSTALSYQIERWSSTAAAIWVLVPSVTGNSTTDIRVYWKKSGQSTASSASTVFATSNSFAGVWHLGETGNSNADGYADATGNAAHAQGTNFSGGNEASAAVGYGQTFASASSRKITVKAAAESNFDITSAITVSAWINVTSWTVAWQAILTKGDGAWRLHRNSTNGTLNFVCNGLTTNTSISGGTTLSTGTWYYATAVYDGGNLRMYLNGASDAAALTATGSITTNNFNASIGENTEMTGRYFNGLIDEARVENVARSADWIKLSYQTQRTDATCILYGSTQSSAFYWNRNDILTSSTDFSKAFNWTLNADGTGRRPTSSSDDDFTSTSIGGSWTCQDSDNDAGTGTCSQSTNYGSLTLSGRGADVWAANNQFTAVRRSDITGDFDVTVKVTSLTVTSVNAKAGIFMANNFTSLGSGGYAGIVLRGDGKVEFLADSTGTIGQITYFSQSGVQITPSGGTVTGAIWLRLVKNGSLVRGFYRTSQASAWTQQGLTTNAQSTSANSQIALLHTSQNVSSTGTAVFDEFQAGMSISSTSLDLSFAGTGSDADANATLSASQAAASINFTGYTGTFNFGAYTLTLNTGDAAFVSGMTTVAGTGTLALTGTSGTQALTPPSGNTLPAVTKTGAGTLQLSTNALKCVSYSQSAGTLDFNGQNISTVANFTLTGGTASSFSDLTGRTLTVGGNAGFTGTSGNLVNLNQGAWTITVSGSLTADYANIAFSDASGGTKGVATRSYNGRNNANWLFSVPDRKSVV